MLSRITFRVQTARAEACVADLAQIAPEGFEEHTDGETTRFVLYAEPDDRETRLAELHRLHGEVTVDHIPRENWREAWKVHFQVVRVGRFVIRPSWRDFVPEARDRVIHLDPGSAFGTGLHESTRLCLRALESFAERASPPQRVLDFGCGSGILALGAALLWPCRVTAVDDDPLARTASEENRAKNGLDDRIEVAGAMPVGHTFDLIVANVSRPVLLEKASTLCSAVTPGGILILSGLLADDGPALSARYVELGLRLCDETREGDWIALQLERSP